MFGSYIPASSLLVACFPCLFIFMLAVMGALSGLMQTRGPVPFGPRARVGSDHLDPAVYRVLEGSQPPAEGICVV